MGGSLVKKISSLAEVGYGVNIYEVAPPQNISGVSTNVAGVVGNFPWGPTTIQSITSWKQFFDTYCPSYFGAEDDYPAVKSLINKKFPGGLLICRATATGVAKSSQDFDDATATESITATARYGGLLGDSVKIAISENADDSADRDVTVSIGSAYSQTYAAVVDGSTGTVTDPGDPFVEITKHASYVAVPAVCSATALAGGSDGTLVGADLVGSVSTQVGIRRFYDESVRPNVLFVADVGDDDTIIDAVNVGLKAYAVDNNKGLAVLLTKFDQTISDAQTDAASYVDDRVVIPYPIVKTTDTFDSDLAEVEVQGPSFAAAAICSVDPWQSPGGAAGAEALKGITALEDIVITRADYENLKDAGIAPFFMSSALGGAIIHRAITAAADGTRIFRRRMADYLTESIAAFLERFVETPCDIDLANRTLGNNTKAEYDAIVGFLQGLKEAGRIKDYGVNPFDANTVAEVAAGRYIIAIQVQLYSMQEEIVLMAEIGETVQVAEAA
jgi:hypothetical protein